MVAYGPVAGAMENGGKVRENSGLREFAGAVNGTVQWAAVPVPSRKSYADQAVPVYPGIPGYGPGSLPEKLRRSGCPGIPRFDNVDKELWLWVHYGATIARVAAGGGPRFRYQTWP